MSPTLVGAFPRSTDTHTNKPVIWHFDDLVDGFVRDECGVNVWRKHDSQRAGDT